MPGFLLHLSQGQLILDSLHNFINISDSFKQSFMLGAIIPDGFKDKNISHFRPPYQKNLITKYPDINYILKHYAANEFSAVDLGILAHLHLDALYVSDFWPDYFEFYDKENNINRVISEISYVCVKRSGIRLPLDEFFSDRYFYGEYDLLNPYIAADFKPMIPEKVYTDTHKIHIAECRSYDPEILVNGLKNYTTVNLEKPDSYPPDTKIFPYDEVVRFLHTTTEKYLDICSGFKILS